MKKKDKTFCEIDHKESSRKRTNKTTFYKHKGDVTWRGIKDVPYKTKGTEWAHIIRRVLIGAKGEMTHFHVRYFEIYPEGFSSLERHKHEHVVICVKGKGVVRTNHKKRTMNFMDIIYISPNTPHQLINPFKKPFGFFCIVNSERDKPKLIKEKTR